jgi:hypothetical protein
MTSLPGQIHYSAELGRGTLADPLDDEGDLLLLSDDDGPLLFVDPSLVLGDPPLLFKDPSLFPD